MTTTFFDDFNRADGLPGNGWSEIGGSNFVIQNDVLTPVGPSVEAGIYRPVDLSGPITFSANITQQNGFGGLLERYTTTILVGNNGDDTSGYGIEVYRGDQDYSDSAVLLVYNGVDIAQIPSTFQFGAAVSVSFTLSTDGSIVGTVTGDGNTFNFSFGPQVVTYSGTNLAIIQDGSDPRSSVLTESTIDNVQITEGTADDPPVIDTANSRVTGTISKASAGGIDSATGVIAFEDPDQTDRPTGSIISQSVATKDAVGNVVTLTPAQISTLEQAFAIAAESGNANNGKIDWSYNIPNQSLGFLPAGDTVTITSTVQIDDHNGGTVTQDLTVNLVFDPFIPYTDKTPGHPTASDVVNAALQYENSLWSSDNCTGLVWAVTEAVGQPFGETASQVPGFSANPQFVPDQGFVVPPNEATNPYGPWLTVETANWQSIVQPGDLVRIPGSVLPDDPLGHSFIVISKDSQGDWLVIDDTDPNHVAGSPGPIIISAHTFNANPSNPFDQEVLNADVAYVSRLMSVPDTGTVVEGTAGKALTYGNGAVVLDGSSLQNEAITAGNGNDAAIGGVHDIITLGNGNDIVNAVDNDTIALGNGSDEVTVGSGNVIGAGNGSDAVLAGPDSTIALGNGSDTVSAGANSTIKVGNGNDTVTAGANSTITIGNGNNNVTAGSESNISLGNGNNTVRPGDNSTGRLGNGNNTVFGGANDIFSVGNGQDQLVAAPGDVWTVGNGQDVITFNAGFGKNTVTDFNTSRDVLQFNHALFVNYAAAMLDTKQVGANTVITYDANDTVTLNGVTASHLTATNFHFS